MGLFCSGKKCPIRDILSWKSTATSASCFLSINLIYFMVFVLRKSLISIISYFLLIPLCLGLIFKVLNVYPEEQGPIQVISKSKISDIVENTYESINDVLQFSREIILWKDCIYTAKCALTLIITGYFASFLSLYSILLLSIWVAFMANFMYTIYVAHVANIVEPQYTKVKDLIKTIIKAIPKLDDGSKKAL